MGRDWPKVKDITGSRFYVKGSVREVKKRIGRFAKKIRVSARGNVEVIHTDIYGRIYRGLKGMKWSHYDKDLE